MRKKYSRIIVVFLVVVIVVGGGYVWVNQSRERKGLMVRISEPIEELDTNDWRRFSSKKIGYSMLIPPGFRDTDPFVLYDVPFDSIDNVIRVIDQQRKIFTYVVYYKEYPNHKTATLPELLLDRLNNPGNVLYETGQNKFVYYFNSERQEDIYAIANNEFSVHIGFTNIEKKLVDEVLKNFEIENKDGERILISPLRQSNEKPKREE